MTYVSIDNEEYEMTHLDATKQGQLAGALMCFTIAGAIFVSLTGTSPDDQAGYQRDAEIANATAIVALLNKRH